MALDAHYVCKVRIYRLKLMPLATTCNAKAKDLLPIAKVAIIRITSLNTLPLSNNYKAVMYHIK